MAQIELRIEGYYELQPYYLYTDRPVEKELELSILDSLQQGEYIVSMNDKVIYDINDLDAPLYHFTIEPTLNTEYEFEELY